MKCPNPQDWDLLAVEALESEQAERMLAHARTCDACRGQLEAARRDHIDRVRTYEAFDRDHDALREQLMAALPDEVPQSIGAGRVLRVWHRLGDHVMSWNTPTVRRAATILAPAACIVIVVAVFFVPGQRSAFAAAIEHLKQAKTIVCEVTRTTRVEMKPSAEAGPSTIDLSRLEEAPEVEAVQAEKLYMSTEHGVRRDTYEDDVLVKTMYVPPDGSALILNPVDRTYQELVADEEWMPEELTEAIAEHPVPDIHFMSLPGDPDRLIRGLRDLTVAADRELGQDTFDGREVIGYEIAGEKVGFGPPWTEQAKENRAELWVDVETGVPARLVFHYVKHVPATGEMPLETSYRLTTVYDQFELDTVLPADWFSAVVPEGYMLREKITPEQMEMPDEEALIEGLRFFGELAGRYPTSLNAMDLGQEVAVLAGSLRAKQLVAKQAGRPEPETPSMESLSKFQGLTLYAFLEMTGHEPEYVEGVVPGDAETVLMRWQLDDGQTRVIYGDLRVETLPAQ